MVMMVRDCSSVFVTRIIANLFPLHESARLYPTRTKINLAAINGVVMQMPDDADSSAENRQGTKMDLPRARKRGCFR
jgi:hypothetical protein